MSKINRKIEQVEQYYPQPTRETVNCLARLINLCSSYGVRFTLQFNNCGFTVTLTDNVNGDEYTGSVEDVLDFLTKRYYVWPNNAKYITPQKRL